MHNSAAQAGFWGSPVEMMVSRSKAKQLWKAMAAVRLEHVLFVIIVADKMLERPV